MHRFGTACILGLKSFDRIPQHTRPRSSPSSFSRIRRRGHAQGSAARYARSSKIDGGARRRRNAAQHDLLRLAQRRRPADESGDALRSCSLRHATAAFPAAQAFDELGPWGARLDPKANEITLGDDAAVLTAQAPHHDHPAWIVRQRLAVDPSQRRKRQFLFLR